MIAIKRARLTFAFGTLGTVAGALLVASFGCAKVTPNVGPNGGSGGAPVGMPPVPGLVSITISPRSDVKNLMADTTGKLTATTSFTAQGMLMDGSTMDVTGRVSWTIEPHTGTASGGQVSVSSPGVYTVTAINGTGPIKDSVEFRANFAAAIPAPGFVVTDKDKLDAPASGAASIAYPLEGAIFPSNFGAVTFHIAKTGAQDIARLTFVGDGLEFSYYGPCEAGPGSGCYVTVPSTYTALFIGPSAHNDLIMTARLASTAGGAVLESPPMHLAWAEVPLSGGLYFWTTINPGSVPGYVSPDPADPRGTAVMRYNFKGDTTMPELVWTDRGSPLTTPPFGESPPAMAGTDPNSGVYFGEGRCIGCHTITPDGKYMAFSIGGSYASSWGLLSIAMPPTLVELDPTASQATAGIDALKRDRMGNFATFTTFGPASNVMVTMYRGRLTLRIVGNNLPIVTDDLFASATTESKTDPFWSPDGAHFTFTSYVPSQDTQPSRMNGDTKTGGQIWSATADANTPHNDARVIVARQAGVTSYYPTISHDGRLLAFNKSSCTGPATPGNYGIGPCDGYDDITAALWLTDPTGTAPVALSHANGGDQNSNSWPRWSPDSGVFRSRRLYWLAFSSRRAYGLQVNAGGSTLANKPQLWFSAILVGDEFPTDPSQAPVWLPNQNLSPAAPTGNHVPQWVKFVVPIQ